MQSGRVVRGGSWNNTTTNCRVAYRNRNKPDNRNNNIGFRPSQYAFKRLLQTPLGQNLLGRPLGRARKEEASSVISRVFRHGAGMPNIQPVWQGW